MLALRYLNNYLKAANDTAAVPRGTQPLQSLLGDQQSSLHMHGVAL
jgi:hypothetical protein